MMTWSVGVFVALLATACATDQKPDRATSPSRKPPTDMAGTVSGPGSEVESHDSGVQSLMGQRVVLGTVEDVVSGQAKVDTGEVQPRFIPMKPRRDKGLPDLKKGDRVEITLNDQNLLVDVHQPGEVGHHRIVRGQLAQPLKTGHEKAVIRTTGGKEEPHFIRPVARSKVASIPVGVEAIFLIDEIDKIVDVTFGDREAVNRAAELWQKKTPLKGNFERIVGVVFKPLEDNRITIRTPDGEEKSYEVRPLVQQAVQGLSEGRSVVLLVDEEEKVTDIALPPTSE
jgi:hypothetical protein